MNDLAGVACLEAKEAEGLPDPFSPLFIRRSGASATLEHALPRLGQHQRRARILAATRTLIARDTYDKLTIRCLASASDVSIQTVYNLIGDRQIVIATAINQHIEAMAQHAAKKADRLTFLLWLVNTYVDCAIRNPDYIAQAAVTYFDRRLSIEQDIEHCAIGIMLRALHDLRRHDLLRDSLDCHLTARRMSVLIAGTMRGWAVGNFSADELRHEMVGSCGLMLMGVVRSSEGDKIENWLMANLVDQRARRH